MQVVIIAAGKSTRTYPLTENRHKALLPILNKYQLERTLNSFKDIEAINEVILIVGHKKEDIIAYFGTEFNNLKITYVIQKEQLGTGHAVSLVEDYIDGPFICMNGDDIYSPKDIAQLIDIENGSIVQEVEEPSRFGVFKHDNFIATALVEKPKEFVSNLANIGLYKFSKDIFNHLKTIELSSRGELELTSAISSLMNSSDFILKSVQDYWIPLGYPWDLMTVTNHLMEGQFPSIVMGKGVEIGRGVILNGPLVIGDGVKINFDCEIGPNTVIGNNVTVDSFSKISNSIIFENCTLGKSSNLFYSIVGANSSISDGFLTEYCLDDLSTVKFPIKGNLVDTGKLRFGCVIGDDCILESNITSKAGTCIMSDVSVKSDSEISGFLSK